MSQDKAYDWDDTIQNDDSFTVIPEGEYDYRVTKFERGNYKGGAKVPACKKAIIFIEVSKDGVNCGGCEENLLLHSKMEWKLSEFFRSIGQKKHGEPLVMNWNEVAGSTGRCKVTVRKFKKAGDGSEESDWTGESNNVQFLDPPETDGSFDYGNNVAEEKKPAGSW